MLGLIQAACPSCAAWSAVPSILHELVILALGVVAYFQARLIYTTKKANEVAITAVSNQATATEQLQRTADATHKLVNGQRENLEATVRELQSKVEKLGQTAQALDEVKRDLVNKPPVK